MHVFKVDLVTLDLYVPWSNTRKVYSEMGKYYHMRVGLHYESTQVVWKVDAKFFWTYDRRVYNNLWQNLGRRINFIHRINMSDLFLHHSNCQLWIMHWKRVVRCGILVDSLTHQKFYYVASDIKSRIQVTY